MLYFIIIKIYKKYRIGTNWDADHKLVFDTDQVANID